MRIAVYTPNTRYGGSEVYTIQMIRDLLAAEHEVLALTHPHRAPNRLRDGVLATGARIHDLGLRTRGDITARDVIDPIEAFGAERALFVFSWIPAQHAAVRAIRRLRVPVTAVVQLAVAEQVDRYAFYKDILTGPHVRLVAVSRENARHLRDGLGVEVRVIWNGADPPRETPPERVRIRCHLRESLQLPLDAPVVLTVARLAEVKSVDLWIEAARRVCRSHPGARFVWAGDDYYRSVVDVVRARCDDPRLHFLGHRDDVGALYHAADLFCLPSRAEGMPLALGEAIAHRVPVVVSSTAGGHSEVIRDGETGLLHALSVEALTHSLCWALDHPASMREMALRAEAEALLEGPRLRAETIELLLS